MHHYMLVGDDINPLDMFGMIIIRKSSVEADVGYHFRIEVPGESYILQVSVYSTKKLHWNANNLGF